MPSEKDQTAPANDRQIMFLLQVVAWIADRNIKAGVFDKSEFVELLQTIRAANQEFPKELEDIDFLLTFLNFYD